VGCRDRAQFVDPLAGVLEVRVNAQGGLEGEQGTAQILVREQDLRHAAQRAEVARLQFEHTVQAGQALVVALLQVVERGALVPGLAVVGRGAQQARQAGFRQIVAMRGDLGRGQIEIACRQAVRVEHPEIPDALLHGHRFGGVLAAGELIE
jgi:hypothetical protein